MENPTLDTIRKIADGIVNALVDRLAGDERFIKAIAESPWMQEAIAASSKELPVDLIEMISKQVERALEHVEINSDNIDDFESRVNSIVDNLSIDSDNVHGLEEFVEGIIENKSITVDSDDVDGLDSAISEAVDEKLEEAIREKADDIIEICKNSTELAQAIGEQLTLTVK